MCHAAAVSTPEQPRTVAVVGLGAVGGLLAGRLALAGHTVGALARGATLDAVRRDGLRLRTPDGAEQVAPVHAEPDVASLLEHTGHPDLLVVGLKAPALVDLAPTLAPLVGPATTVLPAMNGVPWWFARTPDSGLTGDDAHLHSVDPDGAVGAALPLAATLGCVVHLAASRPEPGVVLHDSGDRLIVGEPAGGTSDRAEQVGRLLAGAGFAAEVSDHVRGDIWFKLWGNMTVNPVSALTEAATDRILADDHLRGFMVAAMAEAAAVGAQVGCPVDADGEQRLDLARALGAFRTSMLQDRDAGRPLEHEAMVGVVSELGQRVGVPTPYVDGLLGLVRVLDGSLALARG